MLMFKILFKKFILPKSKNTDEARREFILNILLTGSVILALVAFVENTRSYLTTSLSSIATNAVPPYITFGFLVFFCILYLLSRKGKITLSASILILFLTVSSFYTSWRWGVDIPQALLIFALVIVMSGILLGTRVIFVMTIVIGIVLLVLTYIQEYQFYSPSSNWRFYPSTVGDSVVLVANLVVIALVCWLFNKEMEKALARAKSSEEALLRQRDQLEVMVAERTQELKRVQVEKLMQLYRFAEFGRLSSGLLHELVTPLNIISLNLKRARRDTHMQEKIDKSLERAMVGAERLEIYLRAARKQIQSQDISQEFSMNDEIKSVIQMLDYRARKEKVKLVLNASEKLYIFGNPLKLNQLVTNLVSNSIDAYDTVAIGKDRQVVVTLKKVAENAVITVKDWGSGIEKKYLAKIFDPLFTTKSLEKGTGIGLSLCKEIVEKYFKGTIHVESQIKVGTIFTVTFPIKKSRVYSLKRNKTRS